MDTFRWALENRGVWGDSRSSGIPQIDLSDGVELGGGEVHPEWPATTASARQGRFRFPGV